MSINTTGSTFKINGLLDNVNNAINNTNQFLDYTKQTIDNAAYVKEQGTNVVNDLKNLLKGNQSQPTQETTTTTNSSLNNSVNVKNQTVMEQLKIYIGKPVFWVCAISVGVAIYFWKKCRKRNKW